jgi:hypothetical protein
VYSDETVIDMDDDIASDASPGAILQDEVLLPEENDGPPSHTSIPNETSTAHSTWMTMFQSIQELYDTIQQQQRQSFLLPLQRRSIFWIILLEQNDTCPEAMNSTLRKRSERAAEIIHHWNPTPQKESEALVDSEIPLPPYIHTGQLLVQSENDKTILLSQLAISSTPSILLLTTTMSHVSPEGEVDATATEPIFVVEYSGPSQTSAEIAHGIRHYFDTFALRSQPSMNVHRRSNVEESLNPLHRIQPRQFSSFMLLQQFLVTYAERLLWIRPIQVADEENEEEIVQFRPQYSRPVLSVQSTSPAERFYIHWLFETDISLPFANTASPPSSLNDRDFTLLLLQCRTNTNSDARLHREFDQMAQALQARRDCLFLVIQQDDDMFPCTTDGMVLVYEIPLSNVPLDYFRGLLLTPFPRWSNLFVQYKFSPSLEAPSSDVNSSAEEVSEKPTTNTRLVEFLVKACTDNVLWFDRQLVAPIAFPKYRPIHVVLVVNMHQEIISIATGTLAASSGENRSGLLLSEHPLSRMNQRAVTDFRRTCRHHRLQHARPQLLEQDVVCLIVPSTEVRVLSTMGMVDMWLRADEAIDQFVTIRPTDDVPSPLPTITFPSVLITDQRFGGTRRYYKEFVQDYFNQSDVDGNPIQEYVNSFWQGKLKHIVKSGPPPLHPINDDGVRALTAHTIESILFDEKEQQFHALVLFTVASCGHCKRFWVLWNRLSRFLENIGWDSFLRLYFIDVSENDVLATSLNVTVPSVPTVYYVSPDRRQRIRYNITDELGDGVGSVREVSEILDWLINDLGDEFLDQGRIEQLLRDLEAVSESLTGKG